jgi:protein O-GlcNAc transferase
MNGEEEARQQVLDLQNALESGVQHHSAGRLAEAESLYYQVLKSIPDQPVALHLLGVIAHQKQENDRAVDLISKALVINPDYADAHGNLGIALDELGRLDEAVDSFSKALALNPNFAQGHNNLGNVFKKQGKQDEAICYYEKAIALNPDYAEAHFNLANVYKNQDRLDEAVICYGKALVIKPDYVEALCNLGNAQKDQGKMAAAIESLNKALAFNPEHLKTNNSLGIVHNILGGQNEAIACCRKAIAIDPQYADAHCTLGNALKDLGKMDEAIASYRTALNIEPDFAEAHCNLGNAQKDMGMLDEALASFRAALDAKPYFTVAHSNLLMTELYLPGQTAKKIYELHCEWDGQHGYRGDYPDYLNTPEPDRRLRIGFVSGDFRHHSVSYFLEDIFSEFDKTKLEIFAYATSADEDDLTARLKSNVDKWQKMAGIGDAQFCEIVAADEIDILVDLSGHTAHNRLTMFSRKPAPVQVTWLGYCCTSGLAAIDYILADPYVIPPSDENYYVETPWRLPGTWMSFSQPNVDVAVENLPALKNGYVTFGSFNNLSKMTDATIECWAGILQAIPDSRLLLKAKPLANDLAQEKIYSAFQERGVDRRRLTLKSFSPDKASHLGTYNEVDIALDTFPYSGATTSIEAFWMGVPVLSLQGDKFISHMGESFLHNLDLEQWIARSPEDYVEKAVAMASDLSMLSTLRQGLRNRLLQSQICNAPLFVENLEKAFREMWRIWCDKKNPAH